MESGKLFSSLNKNLIIYIVLMTLVIIDRTLILKTFSFNYVGSDDLIFWQSATDYMHGKFHEPYFYGQNYNFMLESVFAIPLLKSGIPYNYAFPISSSFITLFPFFLFSIVLYRKNHFVESLCFLVIPLFLPIEYGILTSLTRGFVSGLFFSGFFVFALFEPTKKSSWIIAALAFSLGFIFNPNSLVFSFPICLYIFFVNYKTFSFYWISLVTMFPIFSIEFFAKRFYIKNIEYNVHEMWPFDFNPMQMIDNFKDLDSFYGYFTPLVWFAGWSILVVILIIGIFLLKKEWPKGVSLIIGVLFIIVVLGVNKVNDRIDTIFLSSTRMFIGIPLLTGLTFLWSRKMLFISDKLLKYGILIIAVLTISIKVNRIPLVVKRHTTITNYGPVAIKKISDLECECAKMQNINKRYNIDLIIFVPGKDLNVPAAEFYDYACPLLEKNFPTTMMNIYERRTWIFLEEKETVEKTIMLYDNNLDLYKLRLFPNNEVVSTNPTIVIFKENKMTVASLLKRLDIILKRDPYKVIKTNKK